MVGVIITILAIIVLAYFIIKNYYAPIILLWVGLVLLLIAWCMGVNPVEANESTHFFGFDIVEAFTNVMKERLPGLGLMIMVIAGFSTYMEKIGASKALVKVCVKPLQKVRSPYLLLALTYLVGQFIALFIGSATGLGLLLMASIYPLLLALGVSPVAAASVIATTCCLDLGPGDANSLKAAALANITPIEYFVKAQGPVALFCIPCIAIAHYFFQRWFDHRDAAKLAQTAGGPQISGGQKVAAEDLDLSNAIEGAGPSFYAILPMLPLALLFIFSPFIYKAVDLSLVTALLVSILVSFIVDLITHHNFKQCCENSKAIFEGMGKVFTTTVSLIVCAELFALGLQKIGGIDTMISAAAALKGAGAIIMLLVMLGIMSVAAIVTGSGNAAFFAFSPLLPQAAADVGVSTLSMAVPVQMASSIARTMSPIAGVMIAVSGISGLSPVQLVRRTIPVMIVAMIVNITASQFML